METIRKYFASTKQAEKFQNSLYKKWFYVRLKDYPSFTDNGYFEWEISGPNSNYNNL